MPIHQENPLESQQSTPLESPYKRMLERLDERLSFEYFFGLWLNGGDVPYYSMVRPIPEIIKGEIIGSIEVNTATGEINIVYSAPTDPETEEKK